MNENISVQLTNMLIEMNSLTIIVDKIFKFIHLLLARLDYCFILIHCPVDGYYLLLFRHYK